MKHGPGLKMYFLLKMVIFQPAMLVYQKVSIFHISGAPPPAFCAQEQFMRDTGLAAHSAEHSWR